jgi:glycosyltransferase involved in cell wall biosynthesis
MNNKKLVNVLFVETGLGFGGSAVSLYEIVTNLEDCKPHLLFYTQKHSDFISQYRNLDCEFLDLKFNYISKKLFNDGLKRVRTNTLRKILLNLYNALSYTYDIYIKIKIIRILKAKKIEILYANNTIESLLVDCARKARIPCVVHLRGHIDTKTTINNISYLKRLIAPTEKIKSYAIHTLRVPEEKISVIHNSINLLKFQKNSNRELIRKKHSIDENKIVIAMFARIIRMKGQMLLTKAIVRLLREGYDIVCMLVGDTSDFSDGYIDEIKNYISTSGNTHAFVFSGYQTDAPSYYNAADIIIHPSIEDEAFGRIIIEAWAARRPIIASDIAASLELVEDQTTGYLYSKEDETALTERIKYVIQNKNEVQKVIENASHRVEEFATEEVVKSIEDIITND